MIKISASLLAADFARLGEEVRLVEKAGCDMVHIDVMDGHFVPNITMGPMIVKAIRPHTGTFFDVHLMISEPERYAGAYIKAGADGITLHAESCGDHLREVVEEIKAQIRAYCDLRFTEEELNYLENVKWIKGSYVDFLRLWQPRYEDFEIGRDAACGLTIETKGSWLNTSMYEIPTLAIVNEVFFRMNYDYNRLYASFRERLEDKIQKLVDGTYCLCNFSEFGLRRRLSAEAQELAVQELVAHNKDYQDSACIGTSNVYLAKKWNVTPVGTMAHEWIMCTGQGNHKHNPAYSNWYALDAWVKEYGVLNGIALTDTITTDCFLKDFQLTYSTLFSGVRHDSGDPFAWGEKLIAHYESLGIDPKRKTLLFSDSLDFERADKLRKTFKDRVTVAFGIGTYIANDTCEEPLNIVMKTTACNGMDVAKISDTPGKEMCKNEEYVDYLTRCIKWRLEHDR